MQNDFNLNFNGFLVKNGVLVKFKPEKYTGSLNDLRIPEGVTEIGDNAFQQCDVGENEDDFCGVFGLTTVTLPSTCTVLHNGAFFSCRHLSEVICLSKLELIESAAFSDCKSMQHFIDFPEKQEVIPDNLYDMADISSFTMPNQVKAIGDYAFIDNVNLSGVKFNNVEVIGESAFSGCSFLDEVINLPSSVKEVKSQAFSRTEPIAIRINSLDTKLASDAFEWVSTVEDIYVPEGYKVPHSLWGISNKEEVEIIRI